MADVLGASATATLLRRSLKRVESRRAASSGLVIRRDGFEYSFETPAGWRDGNSAEAVEVVREIARELAPILRELTGPVVIRRLGAVPELRHCEIVFEDSP